MKYVKKDGVVKAVDDHLAGDYVSAGWQAAEKSEYEATTGKTGNPVSAKQTRNPGPYSEADSGR